MSIAVIVASIAAFTVVILLLVFLLLFAQSKLVPQGKVKIIINGDKEHPLEVSPGQSLLSALATSEKKIFLPSACGGGGTCAMCKCQVLSGGGDLLPTEEPHINRKQREEHYRLACQVKVRQDLEIHIPEEIFGIKKWECEVVSNYNVATFIKEFVVKLPEGETLDFKPGGYVQIDVPPIVVDFKDIDIRPHPDDPAGPDKFRPEWDKYNMWALKMVNKEPQFRAYSMANHPAEGNIIMLNVRIATPPWDRKKGAFMDVNPGVCSSYIFSRKPGDKVTVSGPYGEFFINPTDREMIYIGGGAGMAPLRSHIFHLFQTERTKRKVSYWYGGRSRRELFYIDHFRKIEKEFPNFRFFVALSEPLPEDNWKVKKNIDDPEGEGFVGFIHQVLYEQYLKNHPEPDEVEYYLCGPPPMLAAVTNMLRDLGVPEENVRYDDFGS